MHMLSVFSACVVLQPANKSIRIRHQRAFLNRSHHIRPACVLPQFGDMHVCTHILIAETTTLRITPSRRSKQPHTTISISVESTHSAFLARSRCSDRLSYFSLGKRLGRAAALVYIHTTNASLCRFSSVCNS